MLNKYIAKQLSKPTGFGGKIASIIMNKQNRPMYDETISILSPSDSDRILDIGCGNGFMLGLLAKQANCTIAGIDISESIIKTAINRNRTFVRSGKMSITRQNADSLSFSDSSFNKVYTVNTAYFWDNPNKVMSEIHRILQPKGIFINTLYTNESLDGFPHTKYGYKRFTEDSLISLGINAGFTTSIVPIFQGAAICVLYSKSDDTQ